MCKNESENCKIETIKCKFFFQINPFNLSPTTIFFISCESIKYYFRLLFNITEKLFAYLEFA